MNIAKILKQNWVLNLFRNSNTIVFIIVMTVVSATPLIKNLTAQNIQNKAKNNSQKSSLDLTNYNSRFENYNQKIKIIDSQNNPRAEFKIIVADNIEKQKYGLMNLKNLPANFGMLFPHQVPTTISMWMKNTLIPLDMIFFDENMRINFIARNTQPMDISIINSPPNSLAVLEVNAGIANKFNLKIGDKLISAK